MTVEEMCERITSEASGWPGVEYAEDEGPLAVWVQMNPPDSRYYRITIEEVPK